MNMPRYLRYLAILCALVCVQPLAAQAPAAPVLHSAYGERLKLSGLRNGGKINDSLFRGAQPQMQGLQELKKLGVTTIVDLRGEDPNQVAWERQQAEALGI